ncbi:unnamed protein product [Ilex paraguariensis]|uniref:Uncharacterized protein n=1 Tax=Ilex paraguariensis TaxID=185542 RepID=A0ABC8R7J0_9AQUA
MGLKIGGQVEKVNGKELSYSEFVERYMVKNQPVVLTGLMDGWRACKDWVLNDGRPNLRFFSANFGSSRVQASFGHLNHPHVQVQKEQNQTLRMGLKIGGQVEKVNGKELSYSEFVERYMVKNQPVVLTGLMDGWRACKDWVLNDGRPNLRFFSANFGSSRVQVADCATREFTDQKRVEMSVAEFIDNWLEVSSMDYDNASTRECDIKKSPLYLKDWHFVKEYPEYVAYTTPLFFCDDWLNLYLDKYRMHQDYDSLEDRNEVCCSDYRFVYMGAKGLSIDAISSFL